MYLSLGNTVVNSSVVMLLIDFEGERRLRVNGAAGIDQADDATAAPGLGPRRA